MHEEDIICMDVHPKAQIVATGEKTAKGGKSLCSVYVWDAQTKRVYACLKGFHVRAVN